MNPRDIIDGGILFFSNQDLIVRVIVLIFLTMYTLFAFILVSQVKTLTNTYHQAGFSSMLQIISLVHAFAVVGLIIITIITM